MKSSIALQQEIIAALEELRRRTKEKLDLIDAEETHGEELDEDSLAEDYEKLDEMLSEFNALDLSFIE